MCQWVYAARGLACKLPEEFLLIHVILEGLAAVDENHRNFVVELAADFDVAIDINFMPREASAAGQFCEALLHDFAEMTSFSGINNDAAGLRHAGILAL
jgi:hypothetical protein